MTTSDTTKLVVNTTRDWVASKVIPAAIEFEHEDKFPEDMVADMRAMGLFGACISEDHGGAGLSFEDYVAVIEEIARGWMSLAGIINSHLVLAHMVEQFGTDEQRTRFLPGLTSGEDQGCLAITEPSGGSDVQSIGTTARKDGDNYIVNGQKQYITNGRRAKVAATLVITDKTASPPHRGMSVLAIESDSPGFSVGQDFKKLGYKGVETTELFFDDCQVPRENLIGTEEGLGFKHMMIGLEVGRLNVAARGVGLARAALEDAMAYAKERVTFGKPIAEHQAIQMKLADMSTKVTAARLLTREAARLKDQGQRVDLLAGQAKLFASETAMENALECMRIFGGVGYMNDLPVERYYRDAPLLIIGEGTNEIQRLVIARRLLES